MSSSGPFGEEQGSALITVLLVIMMVGAIAAAVSATAIFETRAIGSARNYEAAIHVAEAGAEKVYAQAMQSPPWATLPDIPPGDEKAWVLSQPAPATTAVQSGGGSGYGLGPFRDDETGRYFVYGVGTIGAGDSVRQRVVKTQVLPPAPGVGNAALLIGGDLNLQGDHKATGGLVHVNGDIRAHAGWGCLTMLTDDAMTASGAANVSEWCDPKPTEGASTKSIPDVWASELHGLYAATFGASDRWHDLCTFVVSGIERGQIRRGATTPCTGAVIHTDIDASTAGNGWMWIAGTRVWRKEYAGMDEGVWYAHEANIETASSDEMARSTFIASAKAMDPDPDFAQLSGNIDLQGKATLKYYLPLPTQHRFAAFADRDIHTSDNSGSRKLEGMVYARDQLEFQGSAIVDGSVIAGNFEKPTPSPHEGASLITGSSTLTFNASVGGGGGDATVHVFSWDEL